MSFPRLIKHAHDGRLVVIDRASDLKYFLTSIEPDGREDHVFGYPTLREAETQQQQWANGLWPDPPSDHESFSERN